VLSVVVYHLFPHWLPGGLGGVDIFFVISGFVVTAATASRPAASFPALIAGFYARRAVRIVPALVVVLLCTWVAATLLVPVRILAGTSSGTGLGAFFGVSNIVLATAPDDYFALSSKMNPFLHTWSLGVEEQFYLVFPLLLWLALRRRRSLPWGTLAFVAAASLASLGLYARLSAEASKLAFYLMPARFWELGSGVLLFLALPLWEERVRRLPGAWAAALWIASFLAVLFFLVRLPGPHLHIPALILPTGGAAGLIALACARPADFPARLLAGRGPVVVGLASYSIYLWHWPVLVTMRWTIGDEGVLKPLLAASLAVAFGTLSYLYVEQPVRRAFRAGTLSLRRALLLGGLALSAGAAAAWLLLRFQPHLTLTTNFDKPPAVPHSACGGTYTLKEFAGGTERSWPPCRPGEAGLFVVGDSHARVYDLLAATYASRTRRFLARYHHNSCEFPPFTMRQDALSQCRAFYDAVVKAVAGRARAGDIVFLPSLRLAALRDPPIAPADREASRAEAARLLRPLAATGATIVIEAPKPRFESAPFMCVDWFNRSRPYCRAGFSVPRRILLQARARTLGDMRRLAETLPRTLVWDPFPILCPGDPCTAKRGGQWLFSDENHLMPEATLLLLPSFAAAVESAAQPSPPASPPRRRSPT